MAKYVVTWSTVCYWSTTVEAESEEEAINKLDDAEDADLDDEIEHEPPKAVLCSAKEA